MLSIHLGQPKYLQRQISIASRQGDNQDPFPVVINMHQQPIGAHKPTRWNRLAVGEHTKAKSLRRIGKTQRKTGFFDSDRFPVETYILSTDQAGKRIEDIYRKLVIPILLFA